MWHRPARCVRSVEFPKSIGSHKLFLSLFFLYFSHVLFLVLFVFVSFPNETLFFFRLRKGKSSPISFLLSRSRTRPTKKKGGKDERSRFHYYYPIPHPPYKKKERRELVMKNSKTKKKTDSTYSIWKRYQDFINYNWN